MPLNTKCDSTLYKHLAVIHLATSTWLPCLGCPSLWQEKMAVQWQLWHQLRGREVVLSSIGWYCWKSVSTLLPRGSRQDHTCKYAIKSQDFNESNMLKVKFLAVTACPPDEYSSDGNISIWPSVVIRKAKRSNKCGTGTMASETNLFESMTVTTDNNKKVKLKEKAASSMLLKRRCGDCILFPGSQKPARRSTIYMTATPHTMKRFVQEWSRNVLMKGFSIVVVTQPPQSPD